LVLFGLAVAVGAPGRCWVEEGRQRGRDGLRRREKSIIWRLLAFLPSVIAGTIELEDVIGGGEGRGGAIGRRLGGTKGERRIVGCSHPTLFPQEREREGTVEKSSALCR
jgi:hypothetical protein